MYAASIIAERNRIAALPRACAICGNDKVSEIYRAYDGRSVYCKSGCQK